MHLPSYVDEMPYIYTWKCSLSLKKTQEYSKMGSSPNINCKVWYCENECILFDKCRRQTNAEKHQLLVELFSLQSLNSVVSAIAIFAQL